MTIRNINFMVNHRYKKLLFLLTFMSVLSFDAFTRIVNLNYEFSNFRENDVSVIKLDTLGTPISEKDFVVLVDSLLKKYNDLQTYKVVDEYAGLIKVVNTLQYNNVKPKNNIYLNWKKSNSSFDEILKLFFNSYLQKIVKVTNARIDYGDDLLPINRTVKSRKSGDYS